MIEERRQSGFSLMETLLAVGTLAIGLLFVGGTFLAGIYFTTVSTERTIAAVAANEAFAKIRIFDDPNDPNNPNDLSDTNWAAVTSFEQVLYETISPLDPNDPNTWKEYSYPSDDSDLSARQYYWSALCRRPGVGSNLVQVTVFVARKSGGALLYPGDHTRPVPVKVPVEQIAGRSLRILDPDQGAWINEGDPIVDDATGMIYRVLDRQPESSAADAPQVIRLDRNWTGGLGAVWVVPPPLNGGRPPTVAVYQEILRPTAN